MAHHAAGRVTGESLRVSAVSRLTRSATCLHSSKQPMIANRKMTFRYFGMHIQNKNNGTSKPVSKLVHELKAIGLLTLYFGCWLAVLLLVKELVLAEYQIKYSDMSIALIGALVLSKVVLLLERVPLGVWVHRQPAWVDVLLRTTFYTFGVLVVMLLEKGLDGRHQYGGFTASLRSVFQHADIYHVWLNAICISGALLVYNIFSVIRRRLGERGLLKLFLTPLREITRTPS